MEKAKRVLIVDDDAVLRECCSTYLEAHGYEVVEEEQGNNGLHTYRTAEEPWFFVLSDFQFLPGMTIKNGSMLVAAILKINPDQKLAIHSAEPNMVFKALSYLKGIKQLAPDAEVRVMAKPYRMKELLDLLEELTTAQKS